MRDLHYHIIVVLVMTLFSTSVFADAYKCVGMDETGRKISVLYDEDTNTLNVNGNVLKIVAPTTDNQGIATEDYELEGGTMAYVSLIIEGKDRIVMRQRDAKTNDELSSIELACE